MTNFTNHELEVLRPFGPTIAKVKMPQDLIDKLNEYTETVLNDQKKQDELNYGNKLAGNVKQEFIIEKDIMEKIGWGKFLAEGVREWVLKTNNRKITQFNIINSWIVRQFKNEYNPIHWHSGHISGAGFLKLPSTFGKHVQDKGDKLYLGGRLTLIHGTRQFLSNAKLQIIPEVGDFYFFPHYLMHTVYPFKGTEEERRSISFNAIIDENIFNVYGK